MTLRGREGDRLYIIVSMYMQTLLEQWKMHDVVRKEGSEVNIKMMLF